LYISDHTREGKKERECDIKLIIDPPEAHSFIGSVELFNARKAGTIPNIKGIQGSVRE
jgi:hypothetical protein